MNPHTYPAARLAVVGRVLNRNEREALPLASRIGWGECMRVVEDWVLDVRDADPSAPLLGPARCECGSVLLNTSDERCPMCWLLDVRDRHRSESR